MHEEQEIVIELEESPARSEWGKFGIFAGVLLGSVLVLALIRPYIFNTIVPAIMGEGMAIPAAPAVQEPAPLLLFPVVGVEEEALPAEPAGQEETEQAGETEATAGESYPPPQEAVVVEDSGGEEMETAVTYVEHIVQPGENLTNIAQKHNVTIEDILQANDITNPHRVMAGAVLRIPQP